MTDNYETFLQLKQKNKETVNVKRTSKTLEFVCAKNKVGYCPAVIIYLYEVLKFALFHTKSNYSNTFGALTHYHVVVMTSLSRSCNVCCRH